MTPTLGQIFKNVLTIDQRAQKNSNPRPNCPKNSNPNSKCEKKILILGHVPKKIPTLSQYAYAKLFFVLKQTLLA
jgi:hypothetical protein